MKIKQSKGIRIRTGGGGGFARMRTDDGRVLAGAFMCEKIGFGATGIRVFFENVGQLTAAADSHGSAPDAHGGLMSRWGGEGIIKN